MNNLILNNNVQDFINANLYNDLKKLALQKNQFPEIDYLEILNQIDTKSRAKNKLPTWFDTKNIIFPSKISVEQTSSEKTAFYKSEIVSGKNLIDLTGGFGVDDFYFSKKMKTVVHCEIDENLSQIVAHNFKTMNVNNISCICSDSFEIIKNLNQQFDWIYIDPSRRSDVKGKVFLLKDCLPNVLNSMSFYFNYSKNILIKTAPIFDISVGISELKFTKKIHIVALENEVKELLWEIEKDFLGEIEVKTINILKNKNEVFDFNLNENINSDFDLPKKYLYEPNAAIMKSGGFNQICNQFKIYKLNINSHLYTSNDLIEFPGRIFQIQNTIPYNNSNMKLFFEKKKMNITTRNFPESVENIRKKWKIKDGGNEYCFFTTDLNNKKIVLICEKA